MGYGEEMQSVMLLTKSDRLSSLVFRSQVVYPIEQHDLTQNFGSLVQGTDTRQTASRIQMITRALWLVKRAFLST